MEPTLYHPFHHKHCASIIDKQYQDCIPTKMCHLGLVEANISTAQLFLHSYGYSSLRYILNLCVQGTQMYNMYSMDFERS